MVLTGSVVSVDRVRFEARKSRFEMATLTPKCLTMLILPINASGSGRMHLKSGSSEENTALVQHLFKATWKDDHRLLEEADDSTAVRGPTGLSGIV